MPTARYKSLVCTAKKTGIKPRSKQSKFKGSRRYYRGDLLKRLTKGDRITTDFLAQEWQKETQWVVELLREMHTQELIVVCDNQVTLE